MTNLKCMRQVYGLSQSQLSDRSGVNVRLIQDYEQGHKSINNAKAITVHKLAHVLNCTVEDILELDK